MIIVCSGRKYSQGYVAAAKFISSLLLFLILWNPTKSEATNEDLSSFVKDIPKIYRKSAIRVINGQPAVDKRYSFAQVNLMLEEKDVVNGTTSHSHQCGGSLVAPDIILSAAHCRNWFTHIHIDRHDLSDKNDRYETIQASNIIIHPLYEVETYRYDFMLIMLGQPIDKAEFIYLNENYLLPTPDTELRILGWGATSLSVSLQPIFPTLLQQGTVTAISNEACEASVVFNKSLYEGEIYPEMMCAKSSNGIDACSGDSGGPLFMEGKKEGTDLLVGLVSWGRGCNIYPGVYSRISSAFDWIRDTICQDSSDPPNYLKCLTTSDYSTVTPSEESNAEPTILQVPLPLPLPVVESTDTKLPLGTVRLIVLIQLDASSDETAWYILSEDRETLVERSFGLYSDQPSALIREEIILPMNQTYIFTINDSGGNGICCTTLGNGWFQLIIENEDTPTQIKEVVLDITGNGVFQYGYESTFQTYISNNLLHPSPSPSRQTKSEIENRAGDIVFVNNSTKDGLDKSFSQYAPTSSAPRRRYAKVLTASLSFLSFFSGFMSYIFEYKHMFT